MKTKTFDCIAFLNAAAENTRLRLSGLSVRDQVVYWRGRNKEILDEQKRLMGNRKGGREFGFIERLAVLRKQRKPFDCVEMKHQAQERIRKELEGKSPEEQSAYLRRRREALSKSQGQLRKKGLQAQG